MRSSRSSFPTIAPIAFVLALVVLAVGAAAQEVLKFEETKINLGPISDESSQMHAFKFQNVSGRRIRVAISYCHFCAPPLLDKTVLQPGEEGTVLLELDPTGKRGPFSASATLIEEGKPNPHVDVELKGDICPRIWIEPSNMFPRIIRGQGAVGSFSVTGRASNFKVLRVESDVPMGPIEIGEPTEIEEFGATTRKQEITVHFPKDVPLGPFTAILTPVTNDAGTVPKPINVSGQVFGQVDHSPPSVRLSVLPAEFFRASFDITAEEGPLILHSLDITDRDECTSVALDYEPTPDPSHIRVTISGQAAMRDRQLIAINVRAVASTLTMGGEETHDIPVFITALTPRPPMNQPTPQNPPTPPTQQR